MSHPVLKQAIFQYATSDYFIIFSMQSLHRVFSPYVLERRALCYEYIQPLLASGTLHFSPRLGICGNTITFELLEPLLEKAAPYIRRLSLSDAPNINVEKLGDYITTRCTPSRFPVLESIDFVKYHESYGPYAHKILACKTLADDIRAGVAHQIAEFLRFRLPFLNVRDLEEKFGFNLIQDLLDNISSDRLYFRRREDPSLKIYGECARALSAWWQFEVAFCDWGPSAAWITTPAARHIASEQAQPKILDFAHQSIDRIIFCLYCSDPEVYFGGVALLFGMLRHSSRESSCQSAFYYYFVDAEGERDNGFPELRRLICRLAEIFSRGYKKSDSALLLMSLQIILERFKNLSDAAAENNDNYNSIINQNSGSSSFSPSHILFRETNFVDSLMKQQNFDITKTFPDNTSSWDAFALYAVHELFAHLFSLGVENNNNNEHAESNTKKDVSSSYRDDRQLTSILEDEALFVKALNWYSKALCHLLDGEPKLQSSSSSNTNSRPRSKHIVLCTNMAFFASSFIDGMLRIVSPVLNHFVSEASKTENGNHQMHHEGNNGRVTSLPSPSVVKIVDPINAHSCDFIVGGEKEFHKITRVPGSPLTKLQQLVYSVGFLKIPYLWKFLVKLVAIHGTKGHSLQSFTFVGTSFPLRLPEQALDFISHLKILKFHPEILNTDEQQEEAEAEKKCHHQSLWAKHFLFDAFSVCSFRDDFDAGVAEVAEKKIIIEFDCFLEFLRVEFFKFNCALKGTFVVDDETYPSKGEATEDFKKIRQDLIEFFGKN